MILAERVLESWRELLGDVLVPGLLPVPVELLVRLADLSVEVH